MTLLNAEDRLAITETLSLHGHLFDGGHLDRLGEIFAAEVVYDMTNLGMGSFEGIEAIRRAAAQLGDRNPIAHHLTNLVITHAGPDEATVVSKALVIRADGTLGSVNHLDTLVRRGCGWRISRRVITAQRAPMNADRLAPADAR